MGLPHISTYFYLFLHIYHIFLPIFTYIYHIFLPILNIFRHISTHFHVYFYLFLHIYHIFVPIFMYISTYFHVYFYLFLHIYSYLYIFLPISTTKVWYFTTDYHKSVLFYYRLPQKCGIICTPKWGTNKLCTPSTPSTPF